MKIKNLKIKTIIAQDNFKAIKQCFRNPTTSRLDSQKINTSRRMKMTVSRIKI